MSVSPSHGTYFKTGHILRHKASLHRSKKIETKPCIPFYQHRLSLNTNNIENRKLTNSWKLNNFLPSEKWNKKKIKKEIKDFLKLSENGTWFFIFTRIKRNYFRKKEVTTNVLRTHEKAQRIEETVVT